ncbi:transcriptional regulator [Cellulomonas sp. WB94]|uniref:sugar-binding transcriptional regulator n=1 Tax=Cellulomonas sp. WB94 TaxID=2173174 RepID=UPI000D57D32E|nr:sugar-binding domain-containing protein [Cellulomonas sp. WB94]PVU82228.1 transcriptional regulator [Cellulomonas sp. WB94]
MDVVVEPLGDDERARVAAVAELYYLEGVLVEEIGARLGMSRSTVSRNLAKARRWGVIEFVLHRNANGAEAGLLASRLKERYGAQAHVVPTEAAAGPSERLEVVSELAAQRLASIVGSESTVTVAWGTTIEAVGRHLAPSPTRGSRVIQHNGSGNTFTSGVHYAGRVLDLFGLAFTATVHHFAVPAFFDSAETRRAMWAERSVQRVLAMRANADIAVFSVGALSSDVPGHLYRSGYLDESDLSDLQRHGVVGDLGSVFLRADGTSDGIEINDRSTGMPIDDLRQVPVRVLVVSGPGKAPAVAGALRAGAVTDLVVDDVTARAVLDV